MVERRRFKTKPKPEKSKPKSRKKSSTASSPNGLANGHIGNGLDIPISKHQPKNLGKGSNIVASVATRNQSFMRLFQTYKPDYVQQVMQMVLAGATEKDLVVAFKIKLPILRLWALSYPEFAAALSISKNASLADERVKRSMYEMANGYEQDAVKIMNVEGVVRKIKYKEQVPRNFNAAKFWLANRDPLNWGRDPEKDPGNDGGQLGGINISAIRGMSTTQIQDLLLALKSVLQPQQSLQRLDDVTDVDPEDGDGTEETQR